MFYSYLFDNHQERLADLSNECAFIIFSQSGVVKAVESDTPLLPTIKVYLSRNIIKGNTHSTVHYFLQSCTIWAGAESADSLEKKLTATIRPGNRTYM